MDNEPGSLPYAKRKLCDAVYALIGNATIDRRLTYAASYLMLLQPRDLPAWMRDDFQKLKRKLTRIPLSSATSNMPRPYRKRMSKTRQSDPQHVHPVIGRIS